MLMLCSGVARTSAVTRRSGARSRIPGLAMLMLLGAVGSLRAQSTLAQPNDQRQLDACATCASFATTHATPTFGFNGAAVGTRLYYSSELARPTAYVELDVKFAGAQVPTRIQLRAHTGGVYQTLSTGATRAFVRGDTTALRLAAQFDAAGLGTGVLLRDVEVTAFYGDSSAPTSSTLHTVSNVRFLVQDASQSALGRGWLLVGDPRLHLAGNDLLLADGTGGLAYFTRLSCGGSPWSCSYTSPTGDFSTMVRKVKAGTDTVWTRTSRAGEVAEWGNTGLLRSITDRWGNTVEIERMGTGDVTRAYRTKVTTVVNGTTVTKTTTFAYGGTHGKLTSISLPDGRASTFTVADAADGDLTVITDPDGRPALRATYASGRMTSFTGRAPDTTSVEYDAWGQVARIIAPRAAIDGGTTTRDSTVFVSQRRVLLEGQTATATAATVPADRPDSTFRRVTDVTGTSVTTWNAISGAVSRIVTRSASGATEQGTRAYDTQFRLTSANSTDGETQYTWDGPRLATELRLQPNLGFNDSTVYSYTDYDQPDSVRVNGTTRARYFYSGARLAPDSVKADSSVVTRFTYDGAGRPVTVTDRGGNRVVTTSYETTHANPSSVVRTASGVTTATTSYTYDGSGRVLTTTDPASRVVTTSYDSLNRVTRTIGPISDTTRYVTRDSTHTDTLFDAKGQRYVHVRNARGLVTRREDPRGKSDYYWYDRLGRLVKSQNRRGDSLRVEYDGFGRMTRRLAWTAAGQLDTARFAYDNASGLWVVGANAESTDSIVSHHEGPVLTHRSTRGTRAFTITYGYLDGTWTMTRFLEGFSSGVSQWRDTSATARTVYHRARAITDFGGKDADLAVDPYGRHSGTTLPTSTTSLNKVREATTFSWDDRPLTVAYTGTNIGTTQNRTYSNYDVLGRIKDVLQAAAANPTRYHTYDTGGRLSQYQDYRDSLQIIGWDYVWDELHQEWDSLPVWYNIPTLVRSATYSYDKLANRTDKSASLDSANRLLAFDGWTITYDDAGFMTKRKKGADSVVYAWNGLGQLTQVVAPGYTTTYGYDAFGNRVRKTVNGTSTRYVLEEGQVIVELDDAWQPAAKYAYYPGVDRPQSMQRAGKRYYYLADARGNVVAVTDSVGTIKNTYEYTPYGEALATTEAVANPYRYKGRDWDAEARLYFMRARYYDPLVGRFLSEDPIGLAGGINPTAFVGSEPVNFADPSGTFCQLVWDVSHPSDHPENARAYNYHYLGCSGVTLGGLSRPGGYSPGGVLPRPDVVGSGWHGGSLAEPSTSAAYAKYDNATCRQAIAEAALTVGADLALASGIRSATKAIYFGAVAIRRSENIRSVAAGAKALRRANRIWGRGAQLRAAGIEGGPQALAEYYAVKSPIDIPGFESPADILSFIPVAASIYSLYEMYQTCKRL